MYTIATSVRLTRSRGVQKDLGNKSIFYIEMEKARLERTAMVRNILLRCGRITLRLSVWF